MPLKYLYQQLKNSPWFIAAVLLLIYLAVNGYKYSWDDQHLEIPLLKSLIDPTLYQGDYYVESLKKNFTSFFYPVLAKLITVEQIPSVYFVLYLVSRYFLLFWTYKIWLHLSQNKFTAICCVLSFIMLIRVDEFLYRTFSHQEFALAIIMAGIYFFLKERFILSALTLGFAANIHALYSLFPFLYIWIYLLWQVRQHGLKTLLGSGMAFTIMCLPFLIWTFNNRIGHAVPPAMLQDWLTVAIIAAPQNFMFPQAPRIPLETLLGDIRIFIYLTQSYLLLAGLFFLNFFALPSFRQNKKYWPFL